MGNSYTAIQLGDAFISSYHTVLVTDVTYNSDGSIASVELSEANPTASHNGCSYSTVYSGSAALLRMENSYLKGNYSLYRSTARNTVTYTHDCAVPLEGDVCPICGVGMEDPHQDDYVLPGVDISEWQGTVNWKSLAPEISFAILRLGFTGNGSTFAYRKDSQFDDNAAGCRANDVPYGVYYYAGATSVEEAMQEVENVIEYLGLMSGSGSVPDLPVFYDVEEDNNILKLSDTQLKAVITAFCGTLEEMGIKAGVYASASIWNTRLTDSTYNQWARWVAQWNDELTAGSGANLWQFRVGENDSMPGVAAAIDLDYWLGSVGDVSNRCLASITAPGCVEDGALNCTVITGGESFRLLIPPKGHSFANGVCTVCGERQSIVDRFRDVAAKDWFYHAVKFVVENELFAGTTENTFSPKMTMERGMLVTVLYGLAGRPEVEADNSFTDVKKKDYYYTPVRWAAENGIVGGTGTGKFSPRDSITREQVAMILYRYLQQYEPEIEVSVSVKDYPDYKQISKYARTAMAWAVENGIISGVKLGSETLLNPLGSASRAEVATMLKQFASLLQEKGDWSPVTQEER